MNRLIAPLAAAVVLLAVGQAAQAALLIEIDKSAQRMTVTVDGRQLYRWPVSTGRPGYNTPSGTFRPFRMEIDHYSQEWDNAPMPYSIFFTKTGDAVHGTYEVRHLGRAVSHGCVRLSVKHAATLWSLVKQHKMANTTVEVSGAIPGGGRAPVARSQPLPLTADQHRFEPPPRYQPPSYQRYVERPYYAPRSDDRPPPLPFPFFPFGR
ncbi:MAG: L,D-transpeptidase [Pseudolabrys sp.]